MRLAWEVDAGGQCGYTGSVKNITVSVDDETYRRARTKAAEQDTSLSALVRRFLVEKLYPRRTRARPRAPGAQSTRANPRLLRRRSLIARGRARALRMTLRFLDTNILLYSISRDPTETAKRDRAVALIDTGGNALSVQVLQEFYVQATRATRRDALPHDIAADRREPGCGSRCRKRRSQS